MAWPLSQDYNEAIQNPAQSFADPELKQSEALTNALGLPQPCSGNFADVYAVQNGNRKWAVKCFTREIPGLQERYVQISQYLKQVNLPFVVEFSFLEQGIRVRGQWFPILKMQWVEGLALNALVRDNLDKPAILQGLGQIWLRMAVRLREANLAHCDLQHGNVLLVQGSKAGSLSVKLVDYDGMCVPALEFLKSIELGHANFQHPQRLKDGTYGLQIDRFPHLAIYTALRALSIGGKELWDRYDNGDNLLFLQKDFAAPGQSPVLQELLASKDAELRKLTQKLSQAAEKPIDEVPLLEELVTAVQPAPRRQTAVVPATVPESAPPDNVFAQATSSKKPRPKAQPKAGARVGLMAAGVAVVVLGLAAGGWMVATNQSGKPSAPEVAQVQPQQAKTGKRSESRVTEPTKVPETKKEPDTTKPDTTNPDTTKPDTTKPDTTKPDTTKPDTTKPDTTKPDTTKPDTTKPDTKDPPPPPVVKKEPLPDSAALTKAGKVVKDTFKNEYSKLKTAADRTALAAKLTQIASETKDDPVARYALLREARELATQAGDVSAAFQAVEQLADIYEIDALVMKSTALTTLSNSAGAATLSQTLADNCLALLEDAYMAERYDVSSQLLTLAETAVRKLKNVTLLTRVQALERELRQAQKEFEQVKTANETLKQTPDDAEANLLVGKYLCRRKGDWTHGLPLLAKGTDPVLRELAEKDLAAPKEAEKQTIVADGWWELAQKEPELAKGQLLRRAGFWYQSSVAGLTGLAKAKVDKRLAEMEPLLKGRQAGAGKKEVASGKDPLQDWIKSVGAMPPEKQVEEVTKKLQELNSGYEGKVMHRIENNVVTSLTLQRFDQIADISPVRALTGLKQLHGLGNPITRGKLKDLSPLKDLPLTYLLLDGNAVSDLSPLKGKALTFLSVSGGPVTDLSPLKGMPLTGLALNFTDVSDLSPLQGMRLVSLYCDRTPITDLTPLKGMPLNFLGCQSTKVNDLSPLKGMDLKSLHLTGSAVSDLTPLQGMPLNYLTCSSTKVADLSPLKGMQLKSLMCQNTKVTDLSVLKGMPLTYLSCDFNANRDTELLRTITTLKTLNGRPVNEILK